MTNQYIVTDDNGQPLGVFDQDQIISDGTRFAFELAAVCDDEIAIKHIQVETLTRVGVEAFGYVCASALEAMTAHILTGAFAVAKAHGTDLQAGMAAIAEGRTP